MVGVSAVGTGVSAVGTDVSAVGIGVSASSQLLWSQITSLSNVTLHLRFRK